MSTTPTFDALPAPPGALETGGNEILRAAIVASGDLQITMLRAFDDPAMWGLALADVARHAARIFAIETSTNEDSALERICAAFAAEMESPTDLGATHSIS